MNQVKGNGASSTLFQHDRPNNPSRSKFDLSRINNFTLDPGMIVPFDVIPTLPGDSFKISVRLALDTLPLVQTSLTNYKVLTHWYYIKNRDLWKGWNTFVTKGRTGNVNYTVPQVDLTYALKGEYKDGDNTYTEIVPVSHHSLSAFLGVPPEVSGIYGKVDNNEVLNKDFLPFTPKKLNGTSLTSINTGLKGLKKDNALPYVAYQNIIKHIYLNQNLLQGNVALFPEEGDDDWLLPVHCGTDGNNIANFISGKDSLADTDVVNYNGVFSSDETQVDLRLLRYAMFDDDYFTTGLPWLQRGDVQSLQADVSDLAFDSDFVGLSYPNTPIADSSVSLSNVNLIPGRSSSNIQFFRAKDTYFITDNTDATKVQHGLGFDGLPRFSDDSTLPVGFNTSDLKFKGLNVSLTANQLRELIAMSVWQERNARTDGSYNRTIFQHWKVNPRSTEHLPIYIGGSCEYIDFSTVIQNSQSTDDSHLGDTAGFGSTSGGADVASFNCSDYGFIIGLMIIKPNTTYNQGVEHFHFETAFEDYVQPEFEGLSPQPILNKELYIDGTNEDDDLFCYQERYTYLKVRQNINRGLFQVKPDKDLLFGSFTQARWFENRPKLSYQFLCMSPDNIRRDWLAYPVYPTFRCQCLSEVFATRNLAYNSQPNTFGF